MKAPLDAGPTAVLEFDNFTVVVFSRTLSLFDRAMYYSNGLDPTDFDLIVVKSPHTEHHMYDAWIDKNFNVDVAGATSANLKSLGHTICARPIFPLDDDVTFTPRADDLSALRAQHYPTGRSSAITLPSFGSVPGATSFTAPFSLVTACSVSAMVCSKPSLGVAHSACKRHRVLLGLARHRKAHAEKLGVAPHHLGDLLGAHEHALHLGGLVGAAHPALDARVGAPAGRGARQHGGKIAGREPDHRIVRIERGDDHLADLAVGDRIAGARPHDLQDHVLVHDHAFERVATRRK